jgi:sugar phosphate isomerase/epimerase
MLPMKLGIGSYAFTWAVGVPGYPTPAAPMDAPALVAAAAGFGVHLVQICDNLPLQELSEEALGRLAAAAASAHVGLEIGTRGTSRVRLERFLEIARRLGARLVRTLIEAPGTDGLAEAERTLKGALPDFEKAGVTLAIENYEAHRAAELAALIRRLDSPSLGVCLDTVNSFGALESPAEVRHHLLPLAVSIHVKDFTIQRADHRLGFLIEGAPACCGLLDVPGLLEAARGGGRDPGAILELWTPWQGTIESTVERERAWVRESIGSLRRYVQS